MIAVSNTSPLIVLSKTGYIKHLRKLFRRIWIPRSVKLEIFRKNDQTRAKIEKLIKQEFIEIKMIKNTSLAHILNMELGIGESEAIVLGMETKSDYVLLDDLKARLYARSFRINPNFRQYEGLFFKNHMDCLFQRLNLYYPIYLVRI